MKQMYNEFDDPLKNEIELDPKSFKKNPFAKLITPEQKLAMIIFAAFEDSKMTKEQFKKEVDLILA